MPFNQALKTQRVASQDYVVSFLDDLIMVSTASAASAVSLPSFGSATALNYIKHHFIVAKTTSDANAVTVSVADGSLINGAATFALSSQYDAALFCADDQGGYQAFGFKATGSFTSLSAGAITGNDSSLGIDGQAAAQGGAVVVTGGASSTATNAGGAVSEVGGVGNTSGRGGAANVIGGVGGATGVGGKASVTGGAAGGGNTDGGGVVLGGGAKAGTGFIGPVVLGNAQLTPIWYPQAAPASDGGDTPFTATVAQLIAGLLSMTPTTGRAITTPTGAEMDAGVAFADVPATFGFDFTIQNRAAFAATDDIITLTAGATGVTVTGSATVAPGVAARFRAVRTTTATWIFYKIAG
jgi:hypothetical protein